MQVKKFDASKVRKSAPKNNTQKTCEKISPVDLSENLYIIGPADHDSGFIGLESENHNLFFIDNSLQCWPINCASFVDYYRLAILHCGVRNWHYIFTSYQLPTMTCFLLKLVAPARLKIYDDNRRKRRENFDDDEDDDNKITDFKTSHTFDANFIRS